MRTVLERIRVLIGVLLLLAPLPAWAICEAGGASQPSVSLQYVGPDVNGYVSVSVSFSFPNTVNNFQRTIDLYRDGVGMNSYHPVEISGTKEFVVPFACLPTGSHQLLAAARACGQPAPTGFYAEAQASVMVDTTPKVSISTLGPDPAGNTTVSVDYEFPNTSSHLDRYLAVLLDGVVWYSQYAQDHSNVWTIAASGACGTTWRAVAVACGQFTAEDSETGEDRKPEIKSVALLQIGIDQLTKNPILQATVSYDLKNPNGTVQLDLENWVSADGQQHGGPLETYQVPGNQQPANPPSGTKVFTFTAPSKDQLFSVVATATTICGTVKKPASADCSSCPGASANPVYYSDGNMRLSDGDPLPPVAARSLVRTYNSDEQVVALFGRGWTTFLDRRIVVHPGAVSVTTEANELVRFELTAGVFRQTWPTARRELAMLTQNAAAGTYTYRAPGATEVAVFRISDGRLVALRDPAAARELAIGYDGQGRPATVSDTVTEVTWNLTFDGAARRVTAVGVAGHPDLGWSYSYDSNGNLTSVLAPGGSTWRTYEYAADRMTASRDALGNLIESHTYDANGYAISSTGDVDEIANIEFGLAGSVAGERVTRVTYKSGAVAEHSLRAVGNGWRPVQVTGGCASCGTHDATYVHDDRGRVIREQGADGYVTVTVYAGDHVLSVEGSLQPAGCDPQTDAQHCRLGSDALAAAVLEPTNASVSVAYEHTDPLWPDKVTATIRPSVSAPGQVRREDYLYHADTGALISATICGWFAGDPACSERTTLTAFYEGGAAGLAPEFDPGGTFQSAWLALPQPSLLPKSIDGPRADVHDTHSLVYYPIDATVPALLRGRLAATKNAAGPITRYENYDVFGNATRVVDPNGVAMERTFDALGRLVTSTTKGVIGCNTTDDPLCATDLTTTRAYTMGAGPLRLEQRPGGGVTAFAYDARGRVQAVSRGPAENDLRERIETSYDPLTGKKSLERMLAFEAGAWVEKQRQSFAYDSHARLQTVTHADAAAVHYSYDPEDRMATVRDENHAAPNTFYSYDPAGRLASVKQTLAGAPGGVITTSYAYDMNGNLTAVTDPNGNITSYVYDDFGQLASQESPVTGTTAYAYDSAGNLTRMTDARGVATTRVYDPMNRVTTATSTLFPKSEVVSWSYDDPAAGRFAIGRLASMTDPSGSTAYHYERRGLLRDETRTLTGAQYTYTTGFQYDADGNRAVVKYPSTQLTVTYGFDYAGRPTSASNLVTTAAYLPFGPLKTLSFANGTTQTLAYDARYRITSNSLGVIGQNPLAQYTYGHDPAGNITSILDATDPGYDRTFQYDDLHRLTTANTGAALWRHGTYTWDAMGNILSLKLGEIEKGPTDPLDAARPRRDRLQVEENVPLGRSSSFAYNGTTPRLLEVTTNDLSRPVGSDPAGNETSYVATRTYSLRNLLAQVTDSGEPGDPLQHKLTYTYDGRGVRVIRAESPADGPNTTARRFSIYTPELQLLAVTRDDTSNIWAQSASDRNIHYEIVWFAGRPIAQITPAGPSLYTFTDHLGTPILQTDLAGTVTWRAEYEPFGNVWEMRMGTRTAQPLRFPGQEVAMNWEGQEENYNIFRWYRAGWGRYTQPDPIGNQAGTFAYALDDPLGKVDPRGLTPCLMKLEALLGQPDAALTFVAAVLQVCGSDPVKNFFTEAFTPKYNPAQPIKKMNGIPISQDLGVTTGDGTSSWVFQTAFNKGAKQVIQTSGHEVFHQVMRHRKVPYKQSEEIDADMFGWLALGQFSKLTDCECALCQ